MLWSVSNDFCLLTDWYVGQELTDMGAVDNCTLAFWLRTSSCSILFEKFALGTQFCRTARVDLNGDSGEGECGKGSEQ